MKIDLILDEDMKPISIELWHPFPVDGGVEFRRIKQVVDECEMVYYTDGLETGRAPIIELTTVEL